MLDCSFKGDTRKMKEYICDKQQQPHENLCKYDKPLTCSCIHRTFRGITRCSFGGSRVCGHVSVIVTLLVVCILHLAGGAPAASYQDAADWYRAREQQMVGYLGRYGYIVDASREMGPAGLTSKEAYTAAIKRLQHIAHIPETGVVDRRTLELMEKPRCGNSDEIDETPNYSRRRHKRYVTANSKWKKNDLTYRIINTTPDLSAGRVRRILHDAFKVWSVVTPLTFTEVMHSTPDIQIQFAEGYHDDGYPFDGKGSVLAHAFFPGDDKGGDTHFDDAERWTFNSTEGVDLFMVAAHEFGHALGLAHSSNTEALMYPWYQGYTDNFRLPYDDVRGIQTLYGSQDRPLPNTPRPPYTQRPPVVRPDDGEEERPRPRPPIEDDTPCSGNIDAITVIRKEVFFFKGPKFWRRGPNGLAAKPTEISKFWYNLPADGIDALYERSDGKITFFKGERFWVFSSNHMVTNFPVEGRRITELGVGKNVKKIDAVFIWPYNKRTYLVTGDMYWKLNSKEDYIEYDYPRDMSIWRNVPVPLDSAFQHWDGKTYFLKGDQYWEFYDNKMRTRKREGKPIGRLLGCRNGELKGDMTLHLSDDNADDNDGDYTVLNKSEHQTQPSSAMALVSSILVLFYIRIVCKLFL